ncbi:MAG: hypothetical protein IAF02_16275 [Anaerolineae bacterium]|nr:hypothetical protein [Anaerolineae bacterium]
MRKLADMLAMMAAAQPPLLPQPGRNLTQLSASTIACSVLIAAPFDQASSKATSPS